MDDLRSVLEAMAERGRPAGAEVVVGRAEAEVHRPRGRRALRVAIALSAAAAVLVAALVGGGLLYARTKLDDIERLDLGPVLAGSATPAEPMTVLLVGSDTRAGLSTADARRFGTTAEVGSARADTIMVLRIDPAAGRLSVLSLPRDLWLPIDGGPSQRINTALGDGPDALVRTVQDALGIQLDHYVQVDFDGFRQVVDAVGGVTVPFDTPVRDRVTGLRIDQPGCRELDGDQALAFVRSRHLQALIDGRWLTDPRGDLGRIERQQQFVLSALAHAAGARNPLTVADLLDAAADHVSIDDGLSSGDLVALGRRVASVGAGVRPVVLPTEPTRVNGAAVLTASESDLRAAGVAVQTHPAPATPVPGQVDVTPKASCDK
ncbi:MAG: putative LytR family regulatory protein [Acidimicrobiales bacterium]|nr:putative LytR family regulatory protein [Acidimicrobiales bacterium]